MKGAEYGFSWEITGEVWQACLSKLEMKSLGNLGGLCDLWLSSTWPWGDQGRGDIAPGVQKPEKEAGSGNGLRAGWSAQQWCAHREAVGFTWQLTSLPIAQIDKTLPP